MKPSETLPLVYVHTSCQHTIPGGRDALSKVSKVDFGICTSSRSPYRMNETL